MCYAGNISYCMQSFFHWLNALLGYTARERSGFLVMLAIMVTLLSIPPVTRWWLYTPPAFSAQDQQRFDSLVWLIRQAEEKAEPTATMPLVLTPFNPNEQTAEQWIAMGLAAPLAQRIVRYVEKGGKFRKAEDLQKIYGFPATHFALLEPYLRFDTQQARLHKTYLEKPSGKPSGKTTAPFDLNAADSATLVAVKGVGPVLANRILLFREKLGGFYHTDQLEEVYGLPEATAQYLKERVFVQEGDIQKIAIQTADAAALQAHPYLSGKQAYALVKYRKAKGGMLEPHDLEEISGWDAATREKIMPYLEW